MENGNEDVTDMGLVEKDDEKMKPLLQAPKQPDLADLDADEDLDSEHVQKEPRWKRWPAKDPTKPHLPAPIRYKCKPIVKSQRVLRFEQLEKNRGRKRFCRICWQKFTNATNARRHEATFHRDINLTFGCPYCVCSFTTMRALGRHLHRHHLLGREGVAIIAVALRSRMFVAKNAAIRERKRSKLDQPPPAYRAVLRLRSAPPLQVSNRNTSPQELAAVGAMAEDAQAYMKAVRDACDLGKQEADAQLIGEQETVAMNATLNNIQLPTNPSESEMARVEIPDVNVLLTEMLRTSLEAPLDEAQVAARTAAGSIFEIPSPSASVVNSDKPAEVASDSDFTSPGRIKKKAQSRRKCSKISRNHEKKPQCDKPRIVGGSDGGDTMPRQRPTTRGWLAAKERGQVLDSREASRRMNKGEQRWRRWNGAIPKNGFQTGDVSERATLKKATAGSVANQPAPSKPYQRNATRRGSSNFAVFGSIAKE